MNSSVWRDVRSWNGGRSRSGDVIVGLRDGNRIWRVSPDRSVNDYLDEFIELVVEVVYTDLKITVVKFRKGLDPQIQNTITTMAYGRPSDASPEDWYKAAKNVDQNCAANKAFKLAY